MDALNVLCVLLVMVSKYTEGKSCSNRCDWVSWDGWSECSRSCGGGYRYNTRSYCCRSDLASNIEACLANCGKDLSFFYDGNSISERCNEFCHNDGTYTSGGYCSCGHLYEGYCCEREKARKEQPDGSNSCDDVCNWTEWGEWSTCSVSCGGGGEQTRQRKLCCLEEYGDFQNCAVKCGKDMNDQVENRACGDTCLYGGSMKSDGYGCQCLERSFGHCCEQLLPSCTPFPTDVIFVLDSSASQTKEQFGKQLDFVLLFIDHVNISKEEFQIAIVTFSFEAKIEINFNQSIDKEILRDLISNISFQRGATFTNKGLNAALEVARESERRKGMVTLTYSFVLTDGMSTKRQDTKTAAYALKNANVHVIAIGIGKEVSHQELIDIASPGDQFSPSYVFSVGDFNALDTLLKQLVHITCDDCSAVKHFSNIVFLLDESTEMTEKEFEISVDVMTSIVLNADHIGGQERQSFGLIQLGNELKNVIQLSNDQSQSDLVLHLRLIASHTRIDACMKDEQCSKMNITLAINETFHKYYESPDRKNARNFLVVLSNGKYEEPDRIQIEMSKIQDLADVKVFVIGVGSEIDIDGLLSLAKEANHVYISQEDSEHSNLSSMQAEFTYNFCAKH